MKTVQDIMRENNSLANVERFNAMQKWDYKRKVAHAQEMAEAFYSWAKENGCNYYGKTTTRSAPFAIFSRQDILHLALDLNVPVPAEYGEIAMNENGQLYTTKAQRTGCTMCGFGIHIESRPHRFDVLRENNPREWEFWMKNVCTDENGEKYGWGRILDYIGIPWEDLPEGGNPK